VKLQDNAASRHVEGKNKKLFMNNTLTFSIHMHTAPPTQYTHHVSVFLNKSMLPSCPFTLAQHLDWGSRR
jgi:hypothetical protein